MKLLKYIAICAIALIATSCGSVSKNVSYSYDTVRLEMSMSDLEYLGETEISVEYTSYLGIFTSIEKVNGEVYDPTHKRLLKLPSDGKIKSGKLQLAAYKLVELYPDAVYFQVVFETKDKDKLFLGSTNKERAKVRAYNIKK